MQLWKKWLEEYKIENQKDLFLAKREIMQEIVLSGLYRNGFFEKATFYGGTALRIFYGLDRFSEDLDFSLNTKNPDFSLKPFISGILNEFELLGIDVDISIKTKKITSNIESTYLREKTIWGQEIINIEKDKLLPKTKIRIEIDKNPPLKFKYEPKLLINPNSFYINVMKDQYLFASKMHALIFRKWKNRVKGRDWYDFEWFIKQKISLDLKHFFNRAQESGDIPKKQKSDKAIFHNLLNQAIENLDIEKAKSDVIRFIKNPEVLDIWSKKYFKDLVRYIKIA